ncbi:MAG: hypothetical protein H7Y00_06815 [Fimbriimonadaceae bacterium]|nr:hypothetical protein [Chitinophagales bacterium]
MNQRSLSSKVSSLTPEEMKNMDSLNVDFQIRGFCYAYSSERNSRPSNGEAHSSNTPKIVDSSFVFEKKELQLILNEKELVKFNTSVLGNKLYLVNPASDKITFKAMDSRLYIYPEALNGNNWEPIGYLQSSWCGNSYHTIILDTNEYWEFNVPVFKGNFETKMRYALIIDKQTTIYSNEINAKMSKQQFNADRQEGHEPYNIMDPYNN